MIHDAKVLLVLLIGLLALVFGGCRKRVAEAPVSVPADTPAAPKVAPAPRPIPARLPMPTVPSAPAGPSDAAGVAAAKTAVPSSNSSASSGTVRFSAPPAREPLWRQRARNY